MTLAAMELEATYTLTELGVYAEDPNEGEILYCVYRLDEPVTIQAGSDTVLRFYLRQTVSEDGGAEVLCSPAGLITESDCGPVRKKVLATGAPDRTVTVSMSGAGRLPFPPAPPADGKPNDQGQRRMDRNAFRSFGFYGSGTSSFRAMGTAVIHGRIQIYNCSCMVLLENLTVKAAAKMTGDWRTSGDTAHRLCQSAATDSYYRRVRGQGTSVSVPPKVHTVSVIACSVSGCANAVETTTSSVVAHSSIAMPERAYANNDTGVCAYNGGIAILGSGVPAAAGRRPTTARTAASSWQGGTLL